MDDILICGIYNHRVIPLLLEDSGNVAIVFNTANNNDENSNVDYEALLLGQYDNEVLPLLVDSEGKLVYD